MLKTLIKKQLSQLADSFIRDRKSGKQRSNVAKVLFIILYVFLFFCLAFAFFGMSLLFFDGFSAVGLTWLFFAMMGLISIFLSSVIDMFMASTVLFKAKDNELLLSMPIKPIYILLSRMISLYVFGVIFELMTFGPAILVYWIFGPMSVAAVICPIIIFFLNSLIILVLSCLLGWVTAFISSKLKSRAITSVLIAIVILAVYYVCYFRMNELLMSAVENALSIGDKISSYAYPLYAMGLAATGDVLRLLICTLITGALFALMCIIMSKGFIKIATANNGIAKKEYRAKETKQNSAYVAVLKKELKHFSSSPAYMLNMGLGLIILPVLGIAALIKASDILPVVGMLEETLGLNADFLGVALLGIVIMMQGMGCTTAPSISLEGKSLWILRSLPIKAQDVLQAKAAMQNLLIAVPTLLFVIMASIALSVDADMMVLIILAAAAYSRFCSYAGLYLNLRNPRLNWTDETIPIKQSGSVAITLFGSWVVALVLVFVGYLLRNIISPKVFVLILLVIFAILSTLMERWIKTTGAAWFNEL